MHEVFHLDSAFYDASVLGHKQCGNNCSGWDFRFERDVEVTSQQVMSEGWIKANAQE